MALTHDFENLFGIVFDIIQCIIMNGKTLFCFVWLITDLPHSHI